MAQNSAKSIRAGKAHVELGVDQKPMDSGLAAASRKLSGWAKSVTAVAAGIGLEKLASTVGAKALEAITAFTSHGDDIKKASDRLGIGAESLSALEYAAGQSGSSLEGLEKGIRKLQQEVDKAATGNAEAIETFDELGLSVDQLLKMKPDEMWLAVADSLSKVENATTRNARAMKAFGKTGTELIPLLLGGSRGVRALMGEAERVGAIITPEQAAAAEKIGDAFSRISSSFKAGFIQVGSLIAPMADDIETISLFMVDIVKASFDWVKSTAQLSTGIAGLENAWGAFTDAVHSGDLALAMEIAGKGMEQAWAKSIEAMQDKLKHFLTQAQTNLAKFLADQAAGKSDSRIQNWLAERGLDPIGPIENMFRGGGQNTEELKAILDQMNAEAQGGIVSPEEMKRRKERDEAFKKEMDGLKAKAAKEREIAEAVRAAQDWGVGAALDPMARNRQMAQAAIASRGAGTFASGSQFFGVAGGGSPMDRLLKIEEKAGANLEVIAKALSKAGTLVIQ